MLEELTNIFAVQKVKYGTSSESLLVELLGFDVLSQGIRLISDDLRFTRRRSLQIWF